MVKNLLATFSRIMSVVAILAVASATLHAEPPKAMLGLVPIGQDGKVIVQHVYISGPAHAAGLRPGDQILEINGKPMKSAAEVIETVSTFEPNTKLDVRASREGWVKQLTITLAPRENVLQRPLSAGLPTAGQAQSPESNVRPRGFIHHERQKHIDDPYYRAKHTRW